MVKYSDIQRHWKLLAVLLLILLLRLISLGHLALSDPTESRYADIALRMLKHHQYITPQIIIHGQEMPYWGKPPLHFWLTALSFRIFGISEWSSRLPAYLSGLAIVLFTFLLAFRLRGLRTALIACIILTSSVMFFALTGQSAMDVTLSAAIDGAMTAFAMLTLTEKKSLWGNLFFVFLAFGMMTKGPVAPLLVFLAIAVWLAITKEWNVMKNLPWKTGIPLFLILSAPWYVWAEVRTPGFLQYFFLNENFLRYLIRDYGDKYGSGHVYPPGASMIMLVLTFLPWTGALILAFWKNWKEHFADRWQLYLFAWGLIPAVFFLFSKQILATYLLPGFAGLAIAISFLLTESRVAQSIRTLLKIQNIIFIAFFLAAILAAFYYHVSSSLLFAALAMFLFGFAISRRFFKESMNAGVSLTAIGCVLLIAASTFVFGDEVDDKVSAKKVMYAIFTDPVYANDAVVFPSGIPYSALFYEGAFANPNRQELLLHQNDWNDLKHAGSDLFVFSSRQWEDLNPSVKSRLIVLFRTRHWVVSRGLSALAE